MKIGTISLNINTHDLNYGAMLHSFAFQKFLEKYENVETEIIDYTAPIFCGINLKYPMWHILKQGNIKSFLVACSRFHSHAVRFEKFEKFKRTQLENSLEKYSRKELAEAKLDYDIIICESDVIWSPGFMGGDFDETFFLALPSMKNMKRIAYAASIANGDFSEQQENRYKELVSQLDAVSLRESYAVNYTNELKMQNVHAEWVLDPVMLLEEAEYIRITGKRLIPDPYVLIYFPLEHNLHMIKSAREFAKKRGLKVVEVSRFT